MPDYIGDALLPKVIRVTRGADRKFTLRRKDSNGNPVNWSADVYLVIDTPTSPTRVDAAVAGPDAIVHIESAVLDRVRNGTT